MAFHIKHRILWQAAALGSVLALSGCGGSSGDDLSITTISGSVFASGVSGAEVRVLDGNGNLLAGPVTTDSQGGYTIQINNSDLASPLQFVSQGGTFTDEASGHNGVSASDMAAYVAGGTLSAGDDVHATPGSTIMHQLVVQHGLTLEAAQNAFTNAFSYTPDTGVMPIDATGPTSGADEDQLLAGFRAAVMSQLALDLGLSAQEQFALMLALAEDLADGTLDGQGSGGAVDIPGTTEMLPADIANRYTNAIENFRNGNDQSGLTPVQFGPMMPFAKVANSTSYRIQYIEGAMAAAEGKTEFTLRISNLSDSSAATGLSLSLMPMMYMEAHTHSAPVPGNACSESQTTPGEYDCTVYYLMPSTMMGNAMGYWSLKVMAGMSESVTFYPEVTMAMNGNGKHILKGDSSDQLADMENNVSSRAYYLFKSDVTSAMSGHDVSLFIAGFESMMSFPALVTGLTMNSGSMYQLDVSSIGVKLSTDKQSWVDAVEDGNGYFSVAGLSGLTNGTEGSLYVQLLVNGIAKTTDGAASNQGSCDDDVVLCNYYQIITFTPSSGMGM